MRPTVYGSDVLLQPAERVVRVREVRQAWQRRQMAAADRERVDAPDDHDHHHDGRDVHDAQRLLARLGNALDVFPPEIDRHQDREECRRRSSSAARTSDVEVAEDLVESPVRYRPADTPLIGPVRM